MKEITLEELNKMPKDTYSLIDIRDEGLILYGMMPGAVNICFDDPEDVINKKIEAIPKDKKLVLYCEIGRRSRELDDYSCLSDRDCYSLKDGYIGYIRSGLTKETDIEEKRRKAEESIRKKFHKKLLALSIDEC